MVENQSTALQTLKAGTVISKLYLPHCILIIHLFLSSPLNHEPLKRMDFAVSLHTVSNPLEGLNEFVFLTRGKVGSLEK